MNQNPFADLDDDPPPRRYYGGTYGGTIFFATMFGVVCGICLFCALCFGGCVYFFGAGASALNQEMNSKAGKGYLVTKAKYDRIKNGMSYAALAKMFGDEGE
jgi:hypothetical protein